MEASDIFQAKKAPAARLRVVWPVAAACVHRSAATAVWRGLPPSCLPCMLLQHGGCSPVHSSFQRHAVCFSLFRARRSSGPGWPPTCWPTSSRCVFLLFYSFESFDWLGECCILFVSPPAQMPGPLHGAFRTPPSPLAGRLGRRCCGPYLQPAQLPVDPHLAKQLQVGAGAAAARLAASPVRHATLLSPAQPPGLVGPPACRRSPPTPTLLAMAGRPLPCSARSASLGTSRTCCGILLK